MSTPQTNSATSSTANSPESYNTILSFLTARIESKTFNKPLERESQNDATEPEAESSEFVMELDEEDWDNRRRRYTLNMLTPPRHSMTRSVLEEKKSNSAIPDTIGEKEEEEMEDYFLKPKPYDPLISSISVKLPSVESGKFDLKNWGDLQDLLKQSWHVVKKEFETKERLVKELKDAMTEHEKWQMSIREKNDIIHKKRHPEQHQDGDMAKFLSLDQSQRLGNATPFVKELLYLIYDNPKIIAMISKSHENISALKTMEDTLALSFFENLIVDDECENDVLRFYAAVLQAELKDAQKHKDLLHPDLFFNRMWAAYLRRNECKAYIKTMLGDPLLGCIKERTKIKLDINDVKKDVERKRLKLQKAQSFAKSDKSDKSYDKPRVSKQDAEEYFTQETMESSHLKRLLKFQDEDELGAPRFRGKAERSTYRTDLFEEMKSIDKKSETTLDNNSVSPLKALPDQEVAQYLERNFGILKKHLSVVVQSIFNNLENMPTRLRALCKLTHYLTKRKFPNLSEKESYEILINNLFRRWIFPRSVDTSILDHFEPSADLAHNLEEIPKALKKIFDLELYPANDVRSELNEYFKEIIPSVQSYFKELVSVNEEALNEILQAKPSNTVSIKSKSICLSLYEIKLLCECILRLRTELSAPYPTAVSLAEKILEYDQTDNIFSFGINPSTGQAVKSSQMFLLFHEVLFPDHLNPDYLEDFLKCNGIPKHFSDEQKVIYQTKQCLKNFFIGAKSIKSATKWALPSKITLENVLEQFSNKSSCEEINMAKRNNAGQVHISARFVSAVLAELPQSYKDNNYYKLYQEMLEESKAQTGSLDTNLSSIKLQLFDAKEILKAKNERLAEVDKEREKALKRDNIWDFIKSLRIPVCITSPSSMGNMLKDAYKNNANKSKLMSDNIEVHLRGNKGCIHDQFSIMRELTISAGAIAIGSMKPVSSGSKSAASTSSGSSNGGGFDDMSCHLETVDKFISFFGSLKEVKQAIIEGKDEHGVNNAIIFLYDRIKEEILNKYKNIEDDELTAMTEEVENYICKRLYYYVFPPRETEADRKFLRKCKVLEWATCEHLEIAPANRHTKLWQYNADTLNQINNRITPAEKLQCMQECLRIISQVLDLAALKEGSAGAEETLPILLYSILKACPRRMHSNLNFIEMFRDQKRMLGLDGYCFIQVKSAVVALQEANHTFFKMDPTKFLALINEKEREFGLTLTK